MDRKYKSNNNSNINMSEEVDKLFRKNKKGLTQKEFIDLRNEYGDKKFVDRLQEAYIHEDNRVTKKAKKVVRIIKEKYGDRQLPYHYLLEKVSQFQKKYKFSDAVFARFHEILENELIGSKSPEVLIPATKMMKILGYLDLGYSNNNNTSLSDQDARSIQEIIKLNSNPLFRDKQRQAIMQSYTYNILNVINGKYLPQLGDSNTSNLVHPVIAALFVHKIPILDTHFLFSNLANIVDCRYNNKPLEYITDIKLFNALIRDPNDILCNSYSPYTDLLSRIKIQHCLWENVINFREGKFYRLPAFNMILQELELCNLLTNGEKVVMYGNSDGTILRRLLNAFSFRPTLIYHMPKEMETKVLYNSNPFQQLIRPIVSNTSLIHMRPPIQYVDPRPHNITLKDGIKQTQIVIENGKMILKETHVTHSNGVLIFYVDRRINRLIQPKLVGTSFSNIHLNFTHGIPYSVLSSYETLNPVEVEYDLNMEINNRIYKLKSVVIAETIPLQNNKEVIINSSTLFLIDDDTTIKQTWVKYDPIGLNNSNKSYNLNNPIGAVNETRDINDSSSSDYLIKQKGIIYLYELIDTSEHKMYLP